MYYNGDVQRVAARRVSGVDILRAFGRGGGGDGGGPRRWRWTEVAEAAATDGGADQYIDRRCSRVRAALRIQGARFYDATGESGPPSRRRRYRARELSPSVARVARTSREFRHRPSHARAGGPDENRFRGRHETIVCDAEFQTVFGQHSFDE